MSRLFFIAGSAGFTFLIIYILHEISKIIKELEE
jgi:hypothetical protein